MKFILRSLILALAFSAGAYAQSGTITQTPEYIWRVQIPTLTYSAGLPSSVPVQVFYRTDILNGATVIDQPGSTPGDLTVDVAINGTKTVTLGGQTYTYGQAFAVMNAIFAQERAAQLAAIAAAKSAALAAKTSTPSTP